MEIMFKKTLLALAIAGASMSASAATVYVSKTQGVVGDINAAVTATPAADESFGADGVIGGADNNCGALATELGVTLSGTAPNIASADGSNDTISYAAITGKNVKTSVAMTGVGTCDVTAATSLSAVSAKDGVEYSTVKAIKIDPIIVAGIGGYKSEDTITIDLTGAKVDLTETVAPTLSVVGADGVSQLLADVSFTVLDISENQVRFTLQSTDSLADFVVPGAILQLDDVFLDSTGLSTTTAVGVSSFATNTSGTQFDPAANVVITTLVPQYSAEVTNDLDAQIDVGKDRQQFATGPLTDTLNLAVSKNTVGLELTPAEATYVITGDFSWMVNDTDDTNKDGKLSSADIANAVTYAGVVDDTAKSYALNSAMTELTITATVGGAAVDATSTVIFNVPGFDDGKIVNPIIPVQDFTVAIDVQDNKAFSTAAVNMPATEAVDAGEWTLNGSVIYVPYVPFGPNTQPILRHTNKGTRTGDITVRYMLEKADDVDGEWMSLSAANIMDAGPGVRNMLDNVTDALKGEGYDSATQSFKVALEIVTNVPTGDVFVYGGAKISAEGQDRIHLITTKTNQ